MRRSDDGIPHIIHQTWRESRVPDGWREFQESWRRHHPEWEYRLWTDLDLRELILESYPWFLPIYDHYPEKIQRVDAARYFLLHRYGGIYADLDFECLRSFKPLLENRVVVLGLEPEAHFSKSVVTSHGFDRVICNALMASSSGHPFWEHVFLKLVEAHRLPGPLLSTGPLMLTQAVDSYRQLHCVTVLPSKLLYPGSSEQAKEGLLQDSFWRQKNTRDSFALHHWSGSWIQKATPTANASANSIPFTLVSQKKSVMSGTMAAPSLSPSLSSLLSSGHLQPMVSCLMVTRSSRIEFVKQAIACFQAQTYPATELVILNDEGSTTPRMPELLDELELEILRLGDQRIRYVRLPSQGKTLGALRNLAVSSAQGAYVMQWDDDDLYSPSRIETQMAALRATGADACVLSRWRIWWPELKRLAVSKRRGWEGSLLCAKDRLPLYDEKLRRGEDTPVLLRLASSAKVVFIDQPALYTYRVHLSNTTDREVLNEQWSQATEFYWGNSYEPELRSLTADLPEVIRSEVFAKLSSQHSEEPPKQQPIAFGRCVADEALPRVLILTPVKNGAPFVDRYFQLLSELDYPADKLSLGLLESDSVDGTYAALSAKLKTQGKRFSRTALFKRDYGFRPEGDRASRERQLQRRSILARSRNYLLSLALQSEDWVLWLDFDVIDYPADVIQNLLAQEREIVVPHCVFAPGARTFDLNTFVRDLGSQGQDDFEDPIEQPARGVGRRYLESMRDQKLVEVDAVGGTMLLVRADLHREGLVFPAVPYRRHIETEGLSFLARDLGIRSWAMPGLEVVHANQ
jgi:mannosyltransferase OCH1-like enzyme